MPLTIEEIRAKMEEAHRQERAELVVEAPGPVIAPEPMQPRQQETENTQLLRNIAESTAKLENYMRVYYQIFLFSVFIAGLSFVLGLVAAVVSAIR